MSAVVLWLGLLLLVGRLWAGEVMPPKPAYYFNDYAQVVSPAVAQQLNLQLDQFERETSNQLVVAIFPTMQTDSSLEDYCERIFVAWGVGQKGRNNGAVLFVFVQEHKLRIQTGYGLEGALPDITCTQIIRNEIAPRLKQGNYDAAMTAGVQAMMAAAKGEYKGNGSTVNDGQSGKGGSLIPILIIILIIYFVVRSRGTTYGSYGRSGWGSGPWIGGGFGGGGGGFSDGGGGGGGGFTGGGGDSGGGGASGSW